MKRAAAALAFPERTKPMAKSARKNAPAPLPILSHGEVLDRIREAIEAGRALDEVDGDGFSIVSGFEVLTARLRRTDENDVTTMLCVSTAHLPSADALEGVETGYFNGPYGDVISLRSHDLYNDLSERKRQSTWRDYEPDAQRKNEHGKTSLRRQLRLQNMGARTEEHLRKRVGDLQRPERSA